MSAKACPIAAFLKATHGNWRNSIYIECGGCQYGRQELCAGFLLAFDAEAKPIIIRAEQAFNTLGEMPQIDECAALLSRIGFEHLFVSWLVWIESSPHECVLCKLSEPICKFQ